MQFFVIFFRSALILHILRDGIFIAMSAYCTYKISFGPKLATPQLLFHIGNPYKYLPCRYALYCSNNSRRTISWNRLNQKVNVLLFYTYLKKNNLEPFSYLQADVSEYQIYFFCEYHSSVFGWTNHVIHQYRNVMPFVYIFTHIGDVNTFDKAEASFGELNPM